MTIARTELIEKAGDVVVVTYEKAKNLPCFVIGWFFALNESTLRLKITSTRGDSYESMEIPLDLINKVEDYQFDGRQ